MPAPAEMDRYLRSRHNVNDADPLFSTDGGSVFTVDGFGKLCRRIARRSGVRRFHAHLAAPRLGNQMD